MHYVNKEQDNNEFGEKASGDFFVGTIALAGPEEEWTGTYQTNGTDIVFKLDTGAQVNIIPESDLLHF